MNKTRRLLFQIGTVLILLAIAACMMDVVRGHTVYFDNKKLEYEGETYDPPYKVTVYVGGEQVAKLNAKERGMATTIGQNFEMELKIMEVKGGDETLETYQFKLPRKLDGIVVNLPGFLAGLPEEAWMSEFVPIVSSSAEEEEEVPGGDEFEMDDLGDF
ncbi:MAG: hypothetical protein J6W57_02310 [Oscillospiraceae bacterium]|nr:hypothetical protein [Oscillospiraceae bacterium]